MNDLLVEIGRSKIIAMGSSQYFLVPGTVRQQFDTELGMQVIFYRAPGSTDITMKIEPAKNEKAQA